MTNLCIILVVMLKIFFVCDAHRVVRGVNGQPDEGKCYEYKRGGSSGVHWWVCCNNCVDGAPDNTCDKITYQRASSASYCGSCGTNKGNGNVRKDQFACGGCSGQDDIKEKCSIGIYKVSNIPGFCWLFSTCFHRHCSKRFARGSISDEPENCNDGVCDPGETVDNCPADCCFKKNPKCTWKDTCLPECCGDSKCCLDEHCIEAGSARRSISEKPENCSDGVCDPGETVDNCPVDCCFKKNAKCTWNNQCLPKCCGDSKCCLRDHKTSSTGNRRFDGFNGLTVFVIIHLMFKTVCFM